MKQLSGLLVVTLLFCGLLACNEDDKTSKLDLCNELWEYYCESLNQMDCTEAEGCVEAKRSDCAAEFDGTCEALEYDIFMIREEAIPGWIDSKESCPNLVSIEGSLSGTVDDMRQAACADGSAGDDTKTVGERCSEVIDAACTKILEFECVEATQAECIGLLFDNGAIVLGGVTCTDATDSTEATDAVATAADQALAEAEAATGCADFGF